VTEPYGHGGAFASLEGFLRHHIDPRIDYAPEAILPALATSDDYGPLADMGEIAAIRAAAVEMPSLSDDETRAIIAFLSSLTGATATSAQPPPSVPSGLPVDR
jgi:cytochrome c peroxidase